MVSSIAWTIPTPWPEMTSADVQLAELDDRSLVEACVNGHPEAFELIVARHQRSIYQVCYRFLGNHEDARDLAQDVFLRAYRGLRRFRGQSSLSTWLYRIAINVSLNRVSSKAPLATATQPLDARDFVDHQSELAPDRLLREERATRVRQAIAR